MGFFNFKKSNSKFHITTADRNWVDDNFKWIIDSASYPFANARQHQLNIDCFPLTLQSDEFSPENFLLDTCNLLSLDPSIISVEFISDIRDLDNVPWQTEGELCDSTLLHSENDYKIILANDIKRYPKSCIFNLVKQLINIRMRVNNWDFDTGPDSALFTVIAATYFQFGLIQSLCLTESGLRSNGQWERRINRPPEIPLQVMAYSLALFSELIAENNPSWVNDLSSEMHGMYIGARELLEQSPSSIVRQEELEAEKLLQTSDQQYDKNDFEGCIEACQKALFITQHHLAQAGAYNTIGYCYYRMKDYERSLSNFHKTLEILPGFGYAYDNLALAYLRLDNLNEAAKYIELAVPTQYHDIAYSHRNLALFYWSKNEMAAAEKQFQLAFANMVDYVDELEVDYSKFSLTNGNYPDIQKILQPALDRNEPEAIAFFKNIS